MNKYFSDETLKELAVAHESIHKKHHDLREQFLSRSYNSPHAQEFAYNGFCRRLAVMLHAIDTVFTKLPPSSEEIPTQETLLDCTIAIQSFVLNSFGCLDNLAWIWVHEKSVKNKNGDQLNSLAVGFGNKCKEVRASLSPDFVKRLDQRQDWIDNLKGFRDSLAHRIPLYIPPFIVPQESHEKYKELETRSIKALQSLDFEEHESIVAEQNSLGTWRPWMTHSKLEKAPTVVFHAQLIADYNIIDEFGNELIKELER